MLEDTWLPADWPPGIENAAFGETGLYAVLRKLYGVVLVRATDIQAGVDTPDKAQALDVKHGQLALMLLCTIYDEAASRTSQRVSWRGPVPHAGRAPRPHEPGLRPHYPPHGRPHLTAPPS